MKPASQTVHNDVEKVRQALWNEIVRRRPNHAEIERLAGLRKGELGGILAGEVELGVAHLFRILRAAGIPSQRFFLSLGGR